MFLRKLSKDSLPSTMSVTTDIKISFVIKNIAKKNNILVSIVEEKVSRGNLVTWYITAFVGDSEELREIKIA